MPFLDCLDEFLAPILWKSIRFHNPSCSVLHPSVLWKHSPRRTVVHDHILCLLGFVFRSINLQSFTEISRFSLHPSPDFRCFEVERSVKYLWHVRCCGSFCLTRKTVFAHISKQREESWKYHAQRSIFDDSRCLEMWSNTVLSVWYIFSIETETKEKTEK